jgi:carbohydrate-binding DOMON domain-containing protein
MPKLSSAQMKMALFVLSVAFLGFYSSVTVSVAQSTQTSTVTQLTSVYSTNTITTTLTSPTIFYKTTTETLNSTVQGTQVVTQTSLTTITSSYTTMVNGTLTQTITSVITEASTQTTQLLGNVWGESLAIVLVVAAGLSFAVRRLRLTRPRGLVCSECGYRNPPFATSFCVKCGHSLKEK